MKHQLKNKLLLVASSFFILPITVSPGPFLTYYTTPTQNELFASSYKPTIPEISASVTFEIYSPPPKPIIQPQTKPAPEDLNPLFSQYAAQYGVSEEMLRKIASCESGFRPTAANGQYLGMFQFAPSTWVANRKAMGEDSNPALRSDPDASIKTAAFKIARDGTSAWANCAN